MRLSKWIIALATATFAAAPLMAANPPTSQFNVKTSDAGVKYISGGVGNQNAAQMDRLFGEYSFKLVNVGSTADSAYVSKVKANIKNKSGKTVVKTTTDGPWLIAELPVGSYTLSASFNGQNQMRKFNIVENGHERMVLKWKFEHTKSHTPAASKKGGNEHPGNAAGS